MIKALIKIFGCNSKEEDIPNFSFTLTRYDSESEVYLDVKNIDVNIGITKYTVPNIMNECYSFLEDKPETKKFLEFFLGRFFSKNNIKDSTVYITLDDITIRIRNTSLQNKTVLRLIIDNQK